MWKLGLISIALILSKLPLQASESLGRLKPGAAPTDILGGRLTMRLPANARIEALQRGIMAAPESNAEQTRIVIDAGDQRMVVMTYERFALAGTTFERDIRGESEKFPMKVVLQPWPVSAPLKAYAYFPETPTRNEEANLVMGLYLVRSDHTVQELRAYVNPNGAKQFAEASGLAKAICKTISEGKSSLETAGGDRQLYAYSKTRVVVITVPDGYVATRQTGPDFLVHHIRKLSTFGGISPSIGIYLGDHPSRDSDYSRESAGKIFGKSVSWREKSSLQDGRPFVMADALVSLGSWLGSSDLPSYADVFLTAGDNTQMQELKKIAETLRIGEPAKH